MIRRLSRVAFCVGSLLLAGCGQTSTATVSSPLGARSLPAINPPPFIPGPLDGQSTPRAVALRRPLAVMVENYNPDSRPQSGLRPASLVIETLAEGGVTRFMAFYLEHDAPKVGPVRSTRVYFDNWAGAFHAVLAHVGGNDDAQALLWRMSHSVFSIDENRWEISLTNTGTKLFWRSRDRVPPHNLYVNTWTLRTYAQRQGQDWPYTGAALPHKTPAPPGRRGHAGTIFIGYVDPLAPQPNPGYSVQYRYDRATNTYWRYMGGSAHVDGATGRVIAPSNVVILNTGPARADPNAGATTVGSILIPTLGSGTAEFFRDGRVAYGRWQQRDRNAPLRLIDRRGHPVGLNPGQTWIEVVPAKTKVTWSFR